jgi:carbon monoxide dehydrogenase subunit G
MRIESTCTFPTPIEDVFAAVVDADVLATIIPGCERLIQLGPTTPDGTTVLEARMHLGPDDDLYTATVTIERLLRPTHLGLSVRGQSVHGAFTVRGSLDLVAQDEHTVGAYVWDIEARGLPAPLRRRLEAGAGTRFMQTVCDRLAGALRSTSPESNGLADAPPVLRADTRRGKIMLLPPEPPEALAATRLRPLLLGAAWAGAGLLVGLAAMGAAAAIIRRWGGAE